MSSTYCSIVVYAKNVFVRKWVCLFVTALYGAKDFWPNCKTAVVSGCIGLLLAATSNNEPKIFPRSLGVPYCVCLPGSDMYAGMKASVDARRNFCCCSKTSSLIVTIKNSKLSDHKNLDMLCPTELGNHLV